MSVARNSAYNLAAALIPAAVSLVVIPPYISALGEARYGVLALFTMLLGFFGLWDLGISSATAQRIAAAGSNLAMRRDIFQSAVSVNLVLGVTGGLVLVPLAWVLFGHVFKIPPALRPELQATIGWLALGLPIMLLSEVYRGALMGSARFAEISVINIAGSMMSQLAPLAAALWISPRLTIILPVLYAVRVAMLGGYALIVRKHVTQGGRGTFDRSRARDLLSFGGWMTLSSLVGTVLLGVDRFLIGTVLGARAVSHYTVPFQLAERSMIVPGALGQALLPRLAAADDHEARGIAARGLWWLAALLTPGVATGILAVGPFLDWWLDSGFAEAATVPAQVLLIGFWFNGQAICCAVRLQAAGRPRLLAKAHLWEVLPYVAVLTGCLYVFGLWGAAAAFALRLAVDALLLGWFAGLLGEVLKLSALALPTFIIAVVLAARTPFGGLIGLALLAAVGAVALAWLISERQTLLSALR
ncbi:MAG: flippase, partial [Novosphingobium sp.]